MSEETGTVAADNQLLFDKDVPIGDHFILHVSRFDDGDGNETIRGSVKPLTDWGDWRCQEINLQEHKNPANRDIEIAVGTAMSFPVRITGCVVEPDQHLFIIFRRSGPAVDRNGTVTTNDAEDRLAAIKQANQEVASAKDAWDAAEEVADEAKDNAKAKEKEYDKAVAHLVAVINEGGPGPLFERKPSTNGAVAEHGLDEEEEEAEEEGIEGSWEVVQLFQLGLPADVTALLAKHGIETLGDWCDSRAVDIPGLSLDVRQGINDMVQQWFKDHPEHVSEWNTEPTPEPPPTENANDVSATGSAAEAISQTSALPADSAPAEKAKPKRTRKAKQ